MSKRLPAPQIRGYHAARENDGCVRVGSVLDGWSQTATIARASIAEIRASTASLERQPWLR